MRDLQYLAIAALSSHETSILVEISRLVSLHQAQIVYSHVQLHGGHYVINMLLSGNWSCIAKLETALSGLPPKWSIHIHLQRVTHPVSHTEAFPYLLNIIAVDGPHLLNHIVVFLQKENLAIHELFVESYKARHTQLPMVSITIRIQLPTTLSIAEMREQFMLFCDAHNLDAVMEPDKP